MSDAWLEPSSWPALAEGEVHVWRAHLPSARAELPRLTALLPPEEIAGAAKFRSDTQRERWQITRAILRSLLARYLDVTAPEITFALGPHGKPALAQPAPPTLHFNASHSGNHAAFAFTTAGDVGVDLETVRGEMSRHEKILHRCFTIGERAQLAAAPEPERVRAFFRLWTRKEAFVKARGDGVFSGLDQFEVSLTEPRVLQVTGGDATEWQMAALPEIPECVGALVVKAPACVPKFWKWDTQRAFALGFSSAGITFAT